MNDLRAILDEVAVDWPEVCISYKMQVEDKCFISANATICDKANWGDNSVMDERALVVNHCSVSYRSFIMTLERVVGEPS
jgi:carbonic anhydrase/acetyltransferase-like protein (isoleucine patch superfamily)